MTKTSRILKFLEDSYPDGATVDLITQAVFGDPKEYQKVASILQNLKLRNKVQHNRPYWSGRKND